MDVVVQRSPLSVTTTEADVVGVDWRGTECVDRDDRDRRGKTAHFSPMSWRFLSQMNWAHFLSATAKYSRGVLHLVHSIKDHFAAFFSECEAL